MRTTVAILGVLLVSSLAYGEAAADRTPTSIAETFLARIGKGEVGPAYDELFAGSPLTAQPVQIDALKRQTEAALPAYGKTLGVELYEQTRFGEHLVRLIYIQRLEKHPLVWKFWIYKPESTWQVNIVTFNDQLVFQ